MVQFEDVIHVLVNNPKRRGSKAHTRWSAYQTGQTVEEAIEAGVTIADVQYDVARGHIRLEPATNGTSAVTGPRRTPRRRSTKAEVADRRQSLIEIVEEMRPMSVRGVFYQATVRGIVPKEESGYRAVALDLKGLRMSRRMPFHWIVDNTRWMRKPRTHSSVEEALAETAKFYRKALWRDAECHVEVWLEKDALTGVIMPVTSEYDVPLMVARGFSSLSFLHSSAEEMSEMDVPCHVYHLGDFDPSGVLAAKNIEQRLREFAPDAEIHFERLAVLPWQIEQWSLPTRPTKEEGKKSRKHGPVSVELDAIDPVTLRAIVRSAIELHMPEEEMKVLMAAEESEREQIHRLVHPLTAHDFLPV